MSFYLGIMSGTSLDAIDCVIVSFDQITPQIITTQSIEFPNQLKKRLLNLINAAEGSLKEIGTLDTQLGELYAYAANQIIHHSNVSHSDITAIGCHGQTIYHQPNQPYPFTWQLGNMQLIAKTTNLTTIGDFRRLDMAYGGQGAPLAPAFHQAVFKSDHEKRVIVNLGGIANISCLNPKCNDVIGFDTGPSNALLDLWYQSIYQHDKTYDDQGRWAASGMVYEQLLNLLLTDPYFKKSYPKSTGKEYFNQKWLNSYLTQIDNPLKPEDIQATLSQLTAKTIANAILKAQPETESVYLSGGGAYNTDLVKRLKLELQPISVDTTETLGIAPTWVEASLIAWLSMMRLEHRVSNLTSVTGADEQLSLGTIYLPN
ncbi:anhydro-N-acetylmuramic acid kinase [Thiotrichales bacterium 19S3-7]|nr:anhydro-N-acetylmuramic acid kinase [Thiotrichales bacterium 19S3-7]MCF6801145.1 anhydro-N-acetylmuramic acid kinase [Thiotrichales bacterium 19S3-11]